DELGPALLLGRACRRDRARRRVVVRRVPPLRLPTAARGARSRACARPGRGPGRVARAPARVGLDGGARRDDRGELLLPDDAVLLLLRRRRARAGAARRVPTTHPTLTQRLTLERLPSDRLFSANRAFLSEARSYAI